MNYLLSLFLVLLSINTVAVEVSISGTKHNSSITETTVDCGSYKVKSVRDSLDKRLNRISPTKFPDFIPGFMGSQTIVSMEAFVEPSGNQVPRANNIKEISGELGDGRAYLPFSFTCSDDTLIVSYWSGGNCQKCSVYVAFTYRNGDIINPKKVTYKEYDAFKK